MSSSASPQTTLFFARACAWGLLFFGMGCQDASFTKFNNEPEANIRWPTAESTIDREVMFTAQGTVDDLDHDTEDLVVKWYADGELICDGAPDSEGNSLCDMSLLEEEGEIILEVSDPGGAKGTDRENLFTRLDLDPSVLILEPTGDDDSDPNFYVNQAVNFLGLISDTEDAIEDLLVSVSSDLDGEQSVTILPDGTIAGSFNLNRGAHVISLVAEDSSGHASADTVDIQVGPRNQRPECEIVSPETGAAYNPGDVIMLTAVATDPDIPNSELTVLWESSYQGLLGVTEPNSDGDTVLPMGELEPATHSISINVTDEIGAECTDQVVITVGQPPTLNISSPTEGQVFQTSEPIAFQAEITDGEDRPEELLVTWDSTLDGEISTQGADSTGVAEFSLDGLSPGIHVLQVTVEDSSGLFVTDSVTFYVNGVPSAPEILVTNEDDTECSEDARVTSSQALRVCIVAESVDPDGDTVSYQYAWYVDGVLDVSHVDPTVPAEYTSRGESWRVVVTPTDGLSDGVTGWDQTTIFNSPPVIGSLVIEPENPATTDDLSCVVASSTDADGDAISYTYEWVVNGSIIDRTTVLLPADFVDQGDTVSCSATPFDGLENGSPASSASVTVGNSIPVVASASITPVDPAVEYPTAGDPLQCVYTGWADDDAEDVDLSEISWSVDGVDTGVTGSLLSSGYVVDNVVTCIVTPYDGEDYGEPVSDSIIISNSPPTIDNVSITPDPATGIDELTCSWEGYYDIDGDEDNSEATWSINGDYAASGSTLSEGFVGGDDVACVVTPNDGRDSGPPLVAAITITNYAPSLESATITPDEPVFGTEVTCSWDGYFDLDDDPDASYVSWSIDGVDIGTGPTINSGFFGGDTLVCTVMPFDGVGVGEPVTDSVLVGNTQPSVGAVEISPDDPTPGDVITCLWHDYVDVDGDADQSEVQWTLDGAIIGTEPELEISTESGAVLSCTVTPYDGIDYGSPVSTSVTISNQVPTIDSVTITPSPAYAEDVLTCEWTGFVDADDDPDLSVLEWRVGDDVKGSTPYLAGEFLGGDIVLCTVTPYDGKDYGVPKVQAILISNTPPVVVDATVTPESPYRSEELTCTWSGFSDVDFDSDHSTVQWFIDGSPVATGATMPAHTASEDDVVTCAVTAHDGLDAGNTVTSDVTVLQSIPAIADVTISPDPAYTNTPLTCEWIGFADADADPDLSEEMVRWYIDGDEVGAGSILTDVYEIDDLVTCLVTPYDGMHTGTPHSLSTLILNSPPTIDSATLSPDIVYEGDELTCTPGVTTDIDGVTVFTYKYAWEVDGTRISAVSSTLDSTHFDRDEEVICYVSASDGTSYGPETASNPANVLNTAPQLLYIELSPATIYTNDTIAVTLTFFDADGDEVIGGYSWFVNESTISATSDTLSGLAFFDRDDTVSVTVIPYDGTDLGEALASETVVVQNTPPDAPGISITPPEPVAFVDDMLCQVDTESTDADGDVVTYSLGWTRDGGAFAGGTTAILSGDTISADDIRAYESWTCTIVPSDETENGSPGAITVGIESIFAGWPDSDVGLEDANIGFIGDSLGDYLGRSADFIGDVDGDNRDDILMVAPEADDGGTAAGMAYVFLASSLGGFADVPANSADYKWWGEYDDALLGGDYTQSSVALAGAGDVNGDGIADVILGSPGYTPTGDTSEGRAYLILGGEFGLGEGVISSPETNAYIFTGMDGDQVGHSVSGAGDVDGDTRDDLLIGAPFYAGNTGRAYLVSSLDIGVTRELELPADADHVFYGEATGDWAGVRAIGVGDVNGDGRSDILIGASNNDEEASSSGRTYLIFSDSPVSVSFDLEDADRFFNGTSSNDLSGRQLAAAGDVDKDGFPDFMIAATGLDPDGASNAGGVFLFSGGGLSPFANIALDSADWVLHGESAGDKAGTSVDGAGDVDGDGRGDVIVGAPNNDAGGSSTGRSYLVLGYFLPGSGVVDLATANYTFTGENVSDTSGYSVSGGGDLDNDGLDDLLVGAALNDAGGDEAGQVYLLLAPSVFD